MKRKYPWEEWFHRNFSILRKGVDYDCSQSTMVQLLRNKASSKKVKICITDTGSEIFFTIVGKTYDKDTHTNQTTITCEHKNELEGDVRNKEETKESCSSNYVRV